MRSVSSIRRLVISSSRSPVFDRWAGNGVRARKDAGLCENRSFCQRRHSWENSIAPTHAIGWFDSPRDCTTDVTVARLSAPKLAFPLHRLDSTVDRAPFTKHPGGL
jgi:hypothetical protein